MFLTPSWWWTLRNVAYFVFAALCLALTAFALLGFVVGIAMIVTDERMPIDERVFAAALGLTAALMTWWTAWVVFLRQTRQGRAVATAVVLWFVTVNTAVLYAEGADAVSTPGWWLILTAGVVFPLATWLRLARLPLLNVRDARRRGELDLIVTATRDKRPHVRWYAAKSLGEIASTDPAAIAALELATRDKNRHVRAAAERALRAIGSPPEVPVGAAVEPASAADSSNPYTSPRR
jgi:hypothetical protein